MTQLKPIIFISYRHTHAEQVDAAAAALRETGFEVFVDRDNIDPLDDFPECIRSAIDASHAMLVWWSANYTESNLCNQELLLGWQHARRHSFDVARRIWVLKAEPNAHIYVGELEASCSVSYDHTPRRSWPLFRARRVIGELTVGLTQQSARPNLKPLKQSRP